MRPDVVVGYGGYVSMPAYLAARRAGLPIVVHEQNALPGLANKAGARVASRVAVSFPGTRLPKAEYVGLPIRRMISMLDRDALRAEAREFFGLDPDRPTLVVTGGSQGARRLNESVSAAAEALDAAGVQVLHVVGPHGTATPRPTTAPYVVEPFVDRMDYALAAADLMVCRAGASSVTEAAAVGVPAVFVPLPIGNGEQEHNARPVVDAGGALLVADAAFTPEWVAGTVPALATDPARLAAMSAAASGLIPRDADEKLARIVLEVGVVNTVVPAAELGDVHLIGIGGAGPVGHRPAAAGPRGAGERQRRRRLADPRRAARPRRDRPRRPRPPAPRPPRHRRHRRRLDRGQAGQPRVRRGDRAAPRRALPRRGAWPR